MYVNELTDAIEFIVDSTAEDHDEISYFPAGLVETNATEGVWDYEHRHGTCSADTRFSLFSLISPRRFASKHVIPLPADLKSKPRAASTSSVPQQMTGVKALFKSLS